MKGMKNDDICTIFQRWLVVCKLQKPEPEKVNGFDGKKHPPEDAESDPHKQTNIHVIVLSHEKKQKIPAPIALLSNRNLKTPPSRPPPPGGLLRGPQKPAHQKTNTHPWNECCYTTIIVIMCEHDWKKRIRKKKLKQKKNQKASPL